MRRKEIEEEGKRGKESGGKNEQMHTETVIAHSHNMP